MDWYQTPNFAYFYNKGRRPEMGMEIKEDFIFICGILIF